MWKMTKTPFWTDFAEMFSRHPRREVEKLVGQRDLGFSGDI